MTKEEVLKEYRVREILEAARRVIGKFGFEGTTIDRVADEARIAKGTIYLYFPNGKDELLHSAVVEGLRDLTAELRRCDDPSQTPIARLASMVRAMFTIQRNHQDFFKALILDSRFVAFEPGDARETELRNVYIEALECVADLLRVAIADRAIRPIEPQLAAVTLFEMMTAPLRRSLLGLAGAPTDADAEAVMELFLYGVRDARPSGNGNA
ncbi:MAG TPA: TetR/AcrR family transcriptional regulator [Candidatus Binataceae bacterium]|nr:TetR/AcrR family transcriptional regulator [Candidatus Binataceae bacterium]